MNYGLKQTMHIAALIPAAGLSKRMGAFKPLLPLGGAAMVVRVVEMARAVSEIGAIVVVTGHEARRVEAVLAGLGAPETRPACVYNADFEAGEMLSSIQAGLRALPNADAVVLALADQPAVRAETVRRLIEVWLKNKPLMVLPVWRGKRGHPLLLDLRLRGEIMALPRGETLKTVVHRHLNEAVEVEVGDEGILADMDTREEYERMNRELFSRNDAKAPRS
ncbi:MAG TPA: nucleotidyltransferase family protein [Planctomycetota bacterium]|nr:nucleotidyltransferase family protein [Planctomycetota bacterium]